MLEKSSFSLFSFLLTICRRQEGSIQLYYLCFFINSFHRVFIDKICRKEISSTKSTPLLSCQCHIIGGHSSVNHNKVIDEMLINVKYVTYIPSMKQNTNLSCHEFHHGWCWVILDGSRDINLLEKDL